MNIELNMGYDEINKSIEDINNWEEVKNGEVIDINGNVAWEVKKKGKTKMEIWVWSKFSERLEKPFLAEVSRKEFENMLL